MSRGQRKREEFVGKADGEFEEPEDLRKTAGHTPTERERREHEEEHRSAHREWCEVCVAARGTGAQDQHRQEVRVDQELRGSTIFSGLHFMSTSKRSVHIFAVRFSRSGRIAATALSSKGVKFFERYLEKTGLKMSSITSKTNPSTLALTDAAARSPPFVESSFASCPS